MPTRRFRQVGIGGDGCQPSSGFSRSEMLLMQ